MIPSATVESVFNADRLHNKDYALIFGRMAKLTTSIGLKNDEVPWIFTGSSIV